MELLVCMSISGSIPVVICLLLYVIQRENYNYILGRRLLITGIFFYLIPIQLIKYLIPEEVYPEALFNEEAQLYLSNSLSFWTERKGEYIWMPQWFDIVSKLWLSGIVIFAVYEIIKYWRSAHSIKNFILLEWKSKFYILIYGDADKILDQLRVRRFICILTKTASVL